MSKLWSDSVRLGKLYLKNRVVLTALTRRRCQLDGVPTDLVTEYYGQRTGAGLMFTESAAISQRGIGFPGQANIYNRQQMEGWKKVLKVVHEKGAKMYLQAFHAGRSTHPSFNGGLESWAPSVIKNREKILQLGVGAEYPIPKEVTKEDIKTLKNEYQVAFLLAREAGFDGVQLHGSFGYLIDQFLRSLTNQRTDEYGGNAQNRSRFPLQVVDLALRYFEPHQVSIKLSPTSRIHDMFDEQPLQTYSHLLKELSHRDIAFVELAQAAFQRYAAKTNLPRPEEQIKEVCKTLRPFFKGSIIGNYGFTPESGIKAIREGDCEAVSFGRSYISHPDLAERIINNLPLDNKLDMTTLYLNKRKGKVAGYTDYPFYQPK